MTTAAWVPGTVRAKAMARRRIGRAGARLLAGEGSLDAAVTAVAASPYVHDVRAGQSLAEAQHAVGAAVLWDLRVLAGWLPRAGGDGLRAVAGWFEIANTDELVRTLAARSSAPAYRLGTLGSAWGRLSAAGSLAEVRAILATSTWGDPGADTAWQIALGMRLAWAGRVARAFAPAAPWAAGGAALLVARELFLRRRVLPAPLVAAAAPVLGSGWPAATSVPDFAGRVPAPGRWALAGVDDPEQLWQAEPRWWARLERDGFTLLREPRFGPAPVLGAVAVLAADGWRVRAALELAGRGGTPLEAFDALA